MKEHTHLHPLMEGTGILIKISLLPYSLSGYYYYDTHFHYLYII